jgi:hypothetical protein
VLGTALKIIRNVGLAPVAWLILALAFTAMAVFGWPLVPVVLALAPVAVLVTAAGRKK